MRYISIIFTQFLCKTMNFSFLNFECVRLLAKSHLYSGTRWEGGGGVVRRTSCVSTSFKHFKTSLCGIMGYIWH